MTHPKVTIIILNWNGKEDTIECLESLKHITYPNYEVLLVDNGSTDGSVECFKERCPEIKIIENGKNLGYAEGNNIGIKYALNSASEYILLLNNDTIVSSNFLEAIIKITEKYKTVGIAGPRIMDYYHPDISQSVGVKINLWTGSSHNITSDDLNQTVKHCTKVDYVQGSALLIKQSVIYKIGLLDKRYFMYGEEKDFCMNAKKNSFDVVCIDSVKIWHKESASSKKIHGLKMYYMERNRFLFLNKFASLPQKISFTMFTIVRTPIQFYLSIFREKNPKQFYCFLRGIFAGFRHIIFKSGDLYENKNK